MAALMEELSMEETEEKTVYAYVSNIPNEFHSKHLRNYFSQFLEVGGFQCFHYVHRPEMNKAENEVSNSTTRTSNVAASDDVTPAKKARTVGGFRTFDEANEEAFPRKNTGNIHLKMRKNKKDNAQHRPTGCCVILLTESNFGKLIAMYSGKNWVDSEGSIMTQLCCISRITVVVDTHKVTDWQSSSHQAVTKSSHWRKKDQQAVAIYETMPRSKLLQLIELHPPDIMPNGNVGTPTSVFSQLIKECRLPPKVIKKLGIVFPKSRSNKRYGNVQFTYGGEVYIPEEAAEEEVVTGSGHTVCQDKRTCSSQNLGSSQVRIKRKKKKKKKRNHGETKKQKAGLDNQSNNDNCSSLPKSGSDEDSGEEWDRHEALHNDVTNQERTTERLFESEMEVTWDKGSSGLVFYTDAAYWDKQEGDFDEKTADDWDVDMSGYHEPGGGDKDARDFLQMREQQRRLDGIEIVSAFSPQRTSEKERRWQRKKERMRDQLDKRIAEDLARPIGDFEKHTKGFGRKLMETQGWKEGEGLGKDGNKGMQSALHNDGQNSFDKRGIGYHQKLSTSPSSKIGIRKPKKGKRSVLISTIYDDPEVTDPVERLIRSQGPHSLKYRQGVNFTKAADTALKRLHSI